LNTDINYFLEKKKVSAFYSRRISLSLDTKPSDLNKQQLKNSNSNMTINNKSIIEIDITSTPNILK
jgi:hypothetical protein